jgi:hypothetical protein
MNFFVRVFTTDILKQKMKRYPITVNFSISNLHFFHVLFSPIAIKNYDNFISMGSLSS